MTDTIIRYANGHVVTPGGTWPGATITVDADGRIAGIAPLPRDAGAGAIDLAGGWIMPGFIDTQVNGGGGVLFNDAVDVDGIAAIAAAHRPYGTTALLPTLISDTLEKVAAALDEDFDIEVIEAHHRHKVDAPSGTALMLGEAAAEGRGVKLDRVADRGRDGITGARKRGDIGFTAVRGGDIVGEHDVLFAADGERIVLRHLATDRSIFARGALKAALWGQGRKPGEYDMMDVLGL